MYKLYGKFGLWTSNIYSLVMGICVLSVQCLAFGMLFYDLLGIPKYIGSALPVFAVLAYTAGGIRKVIITDVIQFCVFCVVMLVAVVVGLYEVGRFKVLIENLPRSHKILHIDENNANVFFSIMIFRLMPMTYAPYVQRYLMAETGARLRSSLCKIAVIDLVLNLLVYVIGLIVVVRAPNLGAPDTTMSYFINWCIPPLMKGFMIAAMFAIMMSTLDSWLNSTAVLIGHDILGNLSAFKNPDKQLQIGIKATTVIGVAAVFLKNQ